MHSVQDKLLPQTLIIDGVCMSVRHLLRFSEPQIRATITMLRRFYSTVTQRMVVFCLTTGRTQYPCATSSSHPLTHSA